MSNQRIPAVIKKLWSKHKKLRDQKLMSKMKHQQAVEKLDHQHDMLVKARAKLDADLKIQNSKHDADLTTAWTALTETCRDKKFPIATLIVSDTPKIPPSHEPSRQ